MAKYVCKNCNYRFDGENQNECRFCGMESIEIEKSAGELLEEVRGLLNS